VLSVDTVGGVVYIDEGVRKSTKSNPVSTEKMGDRIAFIPSWYLSYL